MFLGFDPGRDKCGLAVMGIDRVPTFQRVVPATEAIATVKDLCQRFPIVLVIMGNQTTAKQWQQKLEQTLLGSKSPDIVMVDERYTSLEARDRYWEMYPPQGWQRLLPQAIRQPPRLIDDIVAILLIERYLTSLTELQTM